MTTTQFVAVALSTGLALSCVASHAGAQEAEVLELLAGIERLGSADIWPGFEPSEVPVAIFDGERTWLFRHPSPPAGFVPHPTAERVWYADGQHDAVRANTATEFADVMTATLLLSTLDDFPSPLDRAGVALHEAFHAYQKQAHPEWGNIGMGLESPDTDAELLALRRLETDLLRLAIGQADDDQAAAHAAAVIEVRGVRFAGLPPAIVRFERGLELLEGTAQHVQLVATGSRAGLMTLPEEGFPPEALFMRSYAMGLAWTEILQRLRPGWEADIEAGTFESLDEAVADVVTAVKPMDWRAEHPEALNRARADVERVVADRDARRNEFLAREGWRITVEAPAADPLGLRGLDPANLTRLGGNQLLHTRWVRLGHATGEVEVLDRWSLTSGIDDDPLSAGFSRLTVTGFDTLPEVQRDVDVVIVRAAGFTARFERAEVERDGEHLTIRVAPE